MRQDQYAGRVYTLEYISGGPMQTAKIFMNGKSQAVRLPKEFRFEGKEVFIAKEGDNVVLMPKKKDWGNLFSAMGKAGKDFMKKRIQPPDRKRIGF
jgi:antitoxin VapB